MTFKDIIIKNIPEEKIFLTEEELLNESLFLISPAIAFLTLKQKALKSLTNIATPLKKKILLGTAKAQIEIEKARAKIGYDTKNKEDHVYQYTKEQKEFLISLRNKYGNELIKEIEKFRENVLAPYNVLKKNIKKNRRLTNQEINGMTKEEYLKYRESGRKKIERRDSVLGKDYEEGKKDLSEVKHYYDKLKTILQDFKEGRLSSINSNDLEKIYKEMNIGTDNLGGYSLEELQSVVLKIKTNQDAISSYIKNGRKSLYDMMKETSILRTKGFRKSKGEYNKNFEKALNNYLLRETVRNDLRKNLEKSLYKDIYIKVLEKEIEEVNEKKKLVLEKSIKDFSSIQLNEYEKKIWKPMLNNFRKYSGDINDYYQAIKIDDFKETKYFKVPESVKDAENKINRETKRFERALGTILTQFEVNKLKELRLINNIITVRELSNPDTLFKSESEIEIENENEKEDTNEFLNSLKQYINMKFDSIIELEKAQKEIKEKSEKIPSKEREKYRLIIKQFLLRKSIIPNKISEHLRTESDLIDINDIEILLNTYLNKHYSSLNEYKMDNMKLQNKVRNYKTQDPNAEKELSEIQVLFNRFERLGITLTEPDYDDTLDKKVK